MLKAEHLSFTYPKGRKKVLDDFSLSLESGCVYGLLGKNGTGKSTLLHLACGLLTPQRGKVTFRGIDVRRRQPATLRDIFLVPEEFELPPISLSKYIDLYSPFYPRFSRADMDSHLKLFGMDAQAELGKLSMGQKKKVFMSFALATNTALLLMDEPTNGLDIPGKTQFRRFLTSQMSDEKTVVISTHQVRDINTMLDHVLIMDGSRMLLNASTARICGKLRFIESDDRELLGKALYAQPSPQGHLLMLPNVDDEETALDLELLFEATLAAPQQMAALFNENDTKK